MSDARKFTKPADFSPDAQADRLIDRAVVDLHIARRVVLIYPPSHDQVKQSLSRAHGSLSAALSHVPVIKLTVMKEGLALGDRNLEANTAVFVEFAGVLKHFQIATLTFSKGVEIGELFEFLRLISTDPEKVLAEGGVGAVAAKLPLHHIRMQIVDYSKLQMTEEREIQRSSRRGDQEGSVWQEFVAHLMMEGNRQKPEAITSIGAGLDPADLADMLNRRILDAGSAVNHYARTVIASAHAPKGRPELSESLLYFQRMIKGLNPALQKQFLAATFDQYTQLDTIADTAHLVDGLGAELIMRMLGQASSEGKQISPSLLAFINKIGNVDLAASPAAEAAAPPESLSSQKLESLLAQEQYETYVDSEYGRLLADLTHKQHNAAPAADTRPWIQEIEAELSDDRINAHAGRAMARLMKSSGEVSGYRDWARQLAYLLNDLLETRAFGFLTELMAFVRQEKAAADTERSLIAGLLLHRFSEPQFVTKAIEVVQKDSEEPTIEVLDFLMEIGEPVVQEIFDEIDPSQTFHDEGVIIRILSHLSTLTAKEALARVKDPRPEYVRRMLRIIRKMGDGESAQQVRSLLEHPDDDIRMEALATLLKFRNKWGLIRLRELLSQPTDPGFMPALKSAGDYRVRDVVPELLAILEQRRDPEQREAALRALGRIGDTRALPVLTKLAHKRWGFSMRQIQRLQQALYETLEGYPMGEIRELLHYGLKQKDAVIQTACRNLLREATRSEERGDSHAG